MISLRDIEQLEIIFAIYTEKGWVIPEWLVYLHNRSISMLDSSEFDANMEMVDMALYRPSWEQPSTCKRPSLIVLKPSLWARLVSWFKGE